MYLSIVMAARNDNYGGGFLQRMRYSLALLQAQLDDNKNPIGRDDVEVIVVEWNPIKNKKKLGVSLDGFDSVKVITVPPKHHKILPNSDKVNVFEYIAKNVGIRAAAGQFILATNPDIILSHAMLKALLVFDFEEGCYYRADRSDLRKEFKISELEGQPHQDVLDACAANVEEVHRKLLTYPYHTNAAGDFTMMSAADWKRLKGYPEKISVETNHHIDSLLIHLAYNSGMKEKILPYPIYHQYHRRTSKMPDMALWQDDPSRAVQTNTDAWGLGGIEL